MSQSEEQDGSTTLPSPPSSPTSTSMPSPDAPEQSPQDQKATQGNYMWF